jgi:DNA-binding IclR family transcriptional regulator
VRIGTLHDGQVLVVHHVFRPDDSLQTLDVGSLLPAHATALGKVLLAHHPRGWGSEIGELTPGQVSLAAPIMDRSGLTAGAMAIFGPPERLLVARQPRGELLAYVREAARAVSRELGAIPW